MERVVEKSCALTTPKPIPIMTIGNQGKILVDKDVSNIVGGEVGWTFIQNRIERLWCYSYELLWVN